MAPKCEVDYTLRPTIDFCVVTCFRGNFRPDQHLQVRWQTLAAKPIDERRHAGLFFRKKYCPKGQPAPDRSAVIPGEPRQRQGPGSISAGISQKGSEGGYGSRLRAEVGTANLVSEQSRARTRGHGAIEAQRL